jgi:hypothetical protein
MAHFNKALTLSTRGDHVQFLRGKKEVVRALWRAARTDAEHAFALAPQDEQTERLLASIREQLDTLDTDPSQEG